jgi:hypothetical protein
MKTASCSRFRLVYSSSVTGNARSPAVIGKLFDVRQMIAPLAIRDLPTALRTKSRFTASLAVGTSVHFASNSSIRPPMSTTKSTTFEGLSYLLCLLSSASVLLACPIPCLWWDGGEDSSNQWGHEPFQGSTTSSPQSSKSVRLRVASLAPRTWTMAAICASAWLIGLPSARR